MNRAAEWARIQDAVQNVLGNSDHARGVLAAHAGNCVACAGGVIPCKWGEKLARAAGLDREGFKQWAAARRGEPKP